ncbi:MAG: pyridoxine 5'-phosphate synthase [Lentisphaerae bacterium GWF2_45_14]|nr:MAG: pyridoxine 5'-phosphate synthase [Lentisphaerae bacterium GWF2_45_14]
MLKLGVNVDHVATVRQARKALLPDPYKAAKICIKAGALQITAHLREDRRHINDADLEKLCSKIKVVNMEMAVTPEMIKIARKLKPHSSCLVPEKRQELTTEGGLDVAGNLEHIKDAVAKLQKKGIVVSLFIDPETEQIKAAAASGSEFIEMHTGSYANASGAKQKKELKRLIKGAELAHSLGLKVNAGHGIDYENIKGILKIPHLEELNIGHSIIARAVMDGMRKAVSEMLGLMAKYRG